MPTPGWRKLLHQKFEIYLQISLLISWVVSSASRRSFVCVFNQSISITEFTFLPKGKRFLKHQTNSPKAVLMDVSGTIPGKNERRKSQLLRSLLSKASVCPFDSN